MATSWVDAVWEVCTTEGPCFPCCEHCSGDGVCSDDHDLPCPRSLRTFQEATS